jgi:hypothetical protein
MIQCITMRAASDEAAIASMVLRLSNPCWFGKTGLRESAHQRAAGR